MPPKAVPVAEADDINEDIDDDGTNAEPKKAAARARAISGDAKNASGRGLAERAGKARVRETLTEDMNDGNQNPTPDSNYNRFYTDPVTGRVYVIDADGNLLGDELVNEYDAPTSPMTMGEIGPADMPREQIADNNADAGQVEPEAAEQGRAVKKSGKVERLEVEQKEAAGDTRGAKEGRSQTFGVFVAGSWNGNYGLDICANMYGVDPQTRFDSNANKTQTPLGTHLKDHQDQVGLEAIITTRLPLAAGTTNATPMVIVRVTG